MNEKVRKGIFFVLLVITLIWGYFSLANHRDKKAGNEEGTPPGRASLTDTSAPITDTLSFSRLIKDYQRKPWGRDPFYHYYKKGQTTLSDNEVRLHLLGILYRELYSQALINGQIVKEGDTVGKYRVTEITRDYVILQRGGKTVTLWVKKESS